MAAAIASTALLGCGNSAVSRGADFYRQGRYIDADQLLEHAEPGLLRLEVQERARYALYRGATYLALGDAVTAQRWLGYGSRLGGAALSALSEQEQQLMRDSLGSLGGAGVWSTASSVAATGVAATGVAATGVAATGAAAAGAGLAAPSVRLNP
ncbi:MAG: hypothetical protein ABI895_30860 [Deltaproteobacteria bacterium]